jgi:hypothetical protein
MEQENEEGPVNTDNILNNLDSCESDSESGPSSNKKAQNNDFEHEPLDLLSLSKGVREKVTLSKKRS